ncbi:MAG TPA: hypothetical protein VH518_15115, partial [Tepidisphaeraceae bacterium]
MSDLVLNVAGGKLRIQPVDESIFHVVYTKGDTFGQKPSAMIVPLPAVEVKFETIEQPDSVTVKTSRLQARVNRNTGAITWLDGSGELLVREPDTGGKHLEPVPVEKRIFDSSIKIEAERTVDGIKQRVANAKVVVDRMAFSTKLELLFSPGEAIYGLGQHEEGILNYRGHCQYLYQQNMKKAMPVIVSTRGYGILWDTTSLAVFHDDAYGSYFCTDVDDEMDFYFIAGPEFDQIVSSLRKLTGKPTMFPRWAY